jgi:hypothetical protein
MVVFVLMISQAAVIFGLCTTIGFWLTLIYFLLFTLVSLAVICLVSFYAKDPSQLRKNYLNDKCLSYDISNIRNGLGHTSATATHTQSHIRNDLRIPAHSFSDMAFHCLAGCDLLADIMGLHILFLRNL